MKKIYYVGLIIVTLWMSGCRTLGYNNSNSDFDLNLTHHVAFAIDDISFQLDETLLADYNNSGMNNINLTMNVSDSDNTEIKLNIPVEFDYYNNPTAVYSGDIYVLNANSNRSYSSLQVDSIFQSKQDTETKDIRDVDTSKISLRNNTLNNIQLKYTTTETSVLDFDLSKDEIKYGRVPNGFSYKVDYEIVHNGTSMLPKLNLIVMAEGYRADQMHWYKDYVKDAFKDAASFHELVNRHQGEQHITNDFFKHYWEQIRIIRMDTISPQTGVDQHKDIDDVKSILNYNIDEEDDRNACDFDRIKHIMYCTHPEGLEHDNVDAFIILINDENCWNYTWAYGNEIGSKFGQPIHTVIIQAPVGYDVNSPTFHPGLDDHGEMVSKGVGTYSIAHELGHALARLRDEYDKEAMDVDSYFTDYRNIDVGENCKWQKLIDKGYGGGSESNFLLDKFEGCSCGQTGYYRPTSNSTMREFEAENIQFGPVNTYHLAASFKIRTSINNSDFSDLTCDEDPENYEWPQYSIDDFLIEWPPEKFQ